MSPIDWALRPLKKYATFTGRAPRAEFWWFFLAVFIVYMVLYVALLGGAGATVANGTEPTTGAMMALGGGALVIGLFGLAILLPTIAVQVRRLHDTNRSGWWVGAFYLLYCVYFVLMFGSLGAMAAGGDPSQVAGAGFGLTMILGLVMFVYGIVLLVFYILPGTKGPNNYGEDPYGSDYGEVFS